MWSRYEGVFAIAFAALVSIGFGLAVSLLSAPQREHREAHHQSEASDRKCDHLVHPFGVKSGKEDSTETGTVKKERYIELCQQIRSANGAENSAYWAWVQAMVAWAGVALAVAATFAASLAAHFTWKQAKSAADQVAIMRREQRPWVVIDSMVATGVAIASPGELQIPIDLHLKNVGAKVATEVRAVFYPYFAGAWDPILVEPERIMELVPPQTSDPTTVFLPPGSADKIPHVLQFAWNGDDRLFTYTTILAVIRYEVEGENGEFGCGFTVSRRALLNGSDEPPGINRTTTIKHWAK